MYALCLRKSYAVTRDYFFKIDELQVTLAIIVQYVVHYTGSLKIIFNILLKTTFLLNTMYSIFLRQRCFAKKASKDKILNFI